MENEVSDKPKLMLPTSTKHRTGQGKNGRVYEAKRSTYPGGAKITSVNVYKTKPPKFRGSKGHMSLETSQTKVTGEGRTPQIDIRGKGAHKKLEKVGLRKPKAKK